MKKQRSFFLVLSKSGGNIKTSLVRNGYGEWLGEWLLGDYVFFYPNLILQGCLEFKSHVLVGGGVFFLGGWGWRLEVSRGTANSQRWKRRKMMNRETMEN